MTLFLSHLLADEKPIIVEAYSFITDKNITIDDIKKYDKEFVKLDENSTYKNEKEQWVKIKLRDDLASGKYFILYNYSDFDLSSFSESQQIKKFKLHGAYHVSFIYDSERDRKVYYFHMLSTDIKYRAYLAGLSEKQYYDRIEFTYVYLLFAGVALGLILMTAIYNGALYYFNREKSFLYYALMQVFMVGVLSFNTGLPQTFSSYLVHHIFIYDYLSLFTAFFATLFARSFLDTKKFLPKSDKVLLFFLVIIIIDMLYFPFSVLQTYSLYSFTTLYFLVVGFMRMRQGYKPARFYFLGWIALTLGILVVEHFEEMAYFDTMLLGSSIEAIFLAIALAYKIRQIQNTKEEQKELLIHQSKLASMGEMIGNIAHQWRQPLTNLSYILMNIEEIDDKKQRNKKIYEATNQLEFMSQTIDDFKDFYEPTKEKENFEIVRQVEDVLTLMHFGDIKVEFDKKENFQVYNYKNEFKQVLLNLFTNSKEALQIRKINNPKIYIKIEKNQLSISDNAGGVSVKDIQKVFEPYFTTKEKSSGIGLYMSKMIVQKNLGGSLSVKNNLKGAMFTISFNPK